MKRRDIDLDHWQVSATDPYPYFRLLSENLPFLYKNEVNAESSFLVSRLNAKSLLLSLIDRGAGCYYVSLQCLHHDVYPKLISPRGALRERSCVTGPNVLYLGSVEPNSF